MPLETGGVAEPAWCPKGIASPHFVQNLMPSSTLVPQWLQMLIRTSISHADQQHIGRVEARCAALPRAPLAQTGRLEETQ